jgi:hypothetical protein
LALSPPAPASQTAADAAADYSDTGPAGKDGKEEEGTVWSSGQRVLVCSPQADFFPNGRFGLLSRFNKTLHIWEVWIERDPTYRNGETWKICARPSSLSAERQVWKSAEKKAREAKRAAAGKDPDGSSSEAETASSRESDNEIEGPVYSDSGPGAEEGDEEWKKGQRVGVFSQTEMRYQ